MGTHHSQAIQVLPWTVANQIAAGEVVERPACVIKECVENSLDAGSTHIEIFLEQGGKQFIRIRDNGSGIAPADLPLAFARHATSKIVSVDDLSQIRTLGFRGEALASIASIARCRLVSCAHEGQGAQIIVSQDLKTTVDPSAHPIGTTLEVEDLFYNAPVRRRFLKSERSELQAVEEVVLRLALSHPEVTFKIYHQQKLLRHYPAVSSRVRIEERLKILCGQSFLANALPVTRQAVGLKLDGWLAHPKLARRSAQQYLFMNQRMIKDRVINHAIKSIYEQHSSFIPGTYPSYILHLEIDPQEVDVNVHPTKQEVRFCEPKLIHDFIRSCCQSVWNEETVGVETQRSPSKQVSAYRAAVSTGDKKMAHADEKVAHVPSRLSSVSVEPVLQMQRFELIYDAKNYWLVDLWAEKSEIFKTVMSHWCASLPKTCALFPIELEHANLSSQAQIMQRYLVKLGFELYTSPQSTKILKYPTFLQSVITPSWLHAQLVETHSMCSYDAFVTQVAHQLPMSCLASLPCELLKKSILISPSEGVPSRRKFSAQQLGEFLQARALTR